MGATQVVCVVISPTLAAGRFSINTVADPKLTIPGPAGMQAGRMQGWVMSVMRAAGKLPMRTVAAPLTRANGMAGCATGVGTGAGGWIGA